MIKIFELFKSKRGEILSLLSLTLKISDFRLGHHLIKSSVKKKKDQQS